MLFFCFLQNHKTMPQEEEICQGPAGTSWSSYKKRIWRHTALKGKLNSFFVSMSITLHPFIMWAHLRMNLIGIYWQKRLQNKITLKRPEKVDYIKESWRRTTWHSCSVQPFAWITLCTTGQKVMDTTEAFRRISKEDWTENQKERDMKVKTQPKTNLFSLVGQETYGVAATVC